MPADRAAALNEAMVAELVGRGVIEDSRIADAFRRVLRHWFLPQVAVDQVYRDRAVVTHSGPHGVPVSSSSQPAVMAVMLGQLELRPGDRVLEVGAGTGYNAALLGRLVGPTGEVVTVDVDPDICAAARAHLQRAGAANVSVLEGDGWWGVGGGGGFNRIEATVGVSDLARAWVEQLSDGGTLVAPLWMRAGLQASVAFRKTGGRLEAASAEPCGFMRLRGPGAGQPAFGRIGSWTVSFDQPSPRRAAALEALLRLRPRSEPAPALSPGWFTPIALRQPDAVHLFAITAEGPVVCSGVLDVSAPGLAVVQSRAGAGETIHTFGDDPNKRDRARRRLLHLIEAEAPVEIPRLAIEAIPSGEPLDDHASLATIARPNFSFVIRRR